MIKIEYDKYILKFESGNDLFSPSKIDSGTIAMLSKAEFQENDKVLDLGCGYGVVGIVAGKIIGGCKVVMSDISNDAIYWAKYNAAKNNIDEIRIIQSNGYENITDKDFTLILSNPPYHSDFSIAKKFIEEGFKRIALGGRMIMVTKRKDWYKNKFISTFGGVIIHEINGYYVFVAEKKNFFSSKKSGKNRGNMSKKLIRKYARQKL